jgi:hypothetical protein
MFCVRLSSVLRWNTGAYIVPQLIEIDLVSDNVLHSIAIHNKDNISLFDLESSFNRFNALFADAILIMASIVTELRKGC